MMTSGAYQQRISGVILQKDLHGKALPGEGVIKLGDLTASERKLSVGRGKEVPSMINLPGKPVKPSKQHELPVRVSGAGVPVKTRLSPQECLEVERTAIALIRRAIRPNGNFHGLEEPGMPLPHFARADLAVRPIGCSEDLWLPVQVKSTRQAFNTGGKLQERPPFWTFQGVRGYEKTPVVCVSLETATQRPPRVWVFSGDIFEGFKAPGKLTITQGGKHDTANNRCSFDQSCSRETHLGETLLSMWQTARRGESSYQLHSLRVVQTQLNSRHLAEWVMLQKTLDLFKTVPGGIEVRNAPSPFLPWDIEIHLSGSPKTKWQKVQLKSASWKRGRRLGFVETNKRVGKQKVPYQEGDFDFLLVSPPQNDAAFCGVHSRQRPTGIILKERWRYFHLIPMKELVRDGVVSSLKGEIRGVKTINLDCSSDESVDHQTNIRSSRLRKWRIDTLRPAVECGHLVKAILSRKSAGSVGIEEPIHSLTVNHSRGVHSVAAEAKQTPKQISSKVPLEANPLTTPELPRFAHFPSSEASLPTGRLPLFMSQFSSPSSDCKVTQHRKTSKQMPLNKRYETERTAIALLRKSFLPSEAFTGLEEPLAELPPYARADLAVRPIGYHGDHWLPVQVKSATRQVPMKGVRRSPTCNFGSVRGYDGMSVVCIALQKNLNQQPKVWLFPGEYFKSLGGKRGDVRITEGGKYDQPDTQGSFLLDGTNGRHVGTMLFSIWQSALTGQGSHRLQSLSSLQTQLSPAHLIEWRMQQKCRELLESVPGGVDVRRAPCAALPHDIEIRLSTDPHMEWQRVQLKSSHWNAGRRLADVPSHKTVNRQVRAYEDGDFDFLLVTSPQNDVVKGAPESLPFSQQRSQSESASDGCNTDRWRHFYFIPKKVLVDEGVLASAQNDPKGRLTLSLDFSPLPYTGRQGARASRLLKWRLDVGCDPRARERLVKILYKGARCTQDSDLRVNLYISLLS
uniref:Uncharacterized protein n=1 Tax=Chromera velia CCMP2878 TaxID=1169474 RepID=A0A0G4HB33_9ALVE|eukprot:Cvel_25860.t1-p1 / transcript=Cvel_25860.t1 / gene=Cvel_25860 / organism=Chromera_velia_CCMP2878 / gene_product=hypothetical protein / transcript_product=hypothetical protein / location=Cvel_scaffold2982:5083-10097(+) / protein_length=964 / sequence_SO=supercontig / SO=protein_coding / is_pseudo=false